jgi:hypothetical protein
MEFKGVMKRESRENKKTLFKEKTENIKTLPH